MKHTKKLLENLPGDLKDIASLIGIENTFKLVHFRGGSYLIIPKCEGLIKEIRNNKIRELYDQGLRVRDLSCRFNLTDRTIISILKETSQNIPLPLLELMEKKGDI
ncbi:hypothetical protein HY745_13425 [Candidatus Desantisbacteria bacterium]|nr:hypothetical protein [Candidatus Desantisbacteria bacterium]